MAENKRAKLAMDRWDPTLLPLEGDELGAYHADTGEVVDDVSTVAITAEIQDALSVSRWHKGRDNGQKYRFRKLELCGSRHMVAQCKSCDTERKPVLEGCGISRLCTRCSLAFAKRRRARFGRARGRAAELLQLLGYTRKKRNVHTAPGGKWSDKMITLTIPHFLLCHVEEGAELLTFGKGKAIDATMARIYAVRAAWPRFARSLGKWFKRGGGWKKKRGSYDVAPPPIQVPLKDGSFIPPPMHRAFEWTVGGDGLGHPHFHLWLIAPFIPAETIMRMWRDALRGAGVPIARDAYVRVKVQAFRHFDRAAVGELVKGGNRSALEWSRLYKHGPSNAFEYADGWTIAAALEDAAPDVVASLYMALEGARLTQASRGFFLDDEPPACETCGAQGCWHVRFDPAPTAADAAAVVNERGPPS